MSAAQFFVGAYVVLVAMLVGSFVNLAADRLPKGESIVRPRSHCRSCGRSLNIVDLLPVMGYALRRGRCATCGVPIGAASPVVEGAAGCSMAFAFAVGGLWPGAVAGFAVVAVGGLVITAWAMWRSPEGTADATPG